MWVKKGSSAAGLLDVGRAPGGDRNHSLLEQSAAAVIAVPLDQQRAAPALLSLDLGHGQILHLRKQHRVARDVRDELRGSCLLARLVMVRSSVEGQELAADHETGDSESGLREGPTRN